MDIATCMDLAKELPIRTLAIYSHIVPAAIAAFLGLYAFSATKRSQLSSIFLLFTLAVTLWLVADVFLWTFPGYDLVAFLWSWIDFVDVTFFVLAAYFFGLLARGTVSVTERVLLIAVLIPSFIYTATGNSIGGLDQPWCEMFNNGAAVFYKSLAEWVSIALMLVSSVIALRQPNKDRRRASVVVFLALLLFLTTFSVTEYLAAQTAIYEINLYGLFVLPVFLIAMVFAITNLEVFKIRHLATQILVYVLIMLIASQLLFLQSSTDALLNGLTLALSVIIGAILLQNEKRQLNSLVEIEGLAQQLSEANVKLRDLDQLKSKFLSFASHQLKSPLTAIKWQSQLLIDGTTGELPKEAIATAHEIEESANHLVELVNEFLNLRKLEEGHMEYTLEPTDVVEMVSQVVTGLKQLAERKHLRLSFENHASKTLCSLDRKKFGQVIQNLVDNAIKYTDTGEVRVRIEDNEPGSIDIIVSDTGHGINAAVIDTLFQQYARDAKDAAKIEGTGLGLYLAKQIVEAHHGRIWVTSPGVGKGSTFYVQLKTISS